ncbi:MAG: hypothetical protein WDZ39_00990 [Candidatus Spechtbacterales bacterium]
MSNSERNEQILLDIVEDYIKTAQPVSSGELLKRRKYKLSSATIRNIMAELSDSGFLYQPHTSAGRVPTEKAYRFYVDKIDLGTREPIKSKRERTYERSLHKMERELHDAMKRSADDAARVISYRLAEMTNSLAFAGLLSINHFYREGLRHILDEPEFLTAENIRDFVDYADSLEYRLENLYNTIQDDISIFIGNEEEKDVSPFSLMAFTSELPSLSGKGGKKSGEKAVFGIIGPMRMPYERNIELMEEIKRLFNELR